MTLQRGAVVLGATGLVGRSLLEQLLQRGDYPLIVAPTRRPLQLPAPRLFNPVTDFSEASSLLDGTVVRDVYCCLGTTMHKAGNRRQFEEVDYHLIVNLARMARAHGAERLAVVSALGASATSRIYYSRVKGRMEEALSGIGYESLQILRPSLLLGARDERRPAEALAQKLSPYVGWLWRGRLATYRPVAAADVAAAMIRLTLAGEPGVHIHTLPLTDAAPD